MGEGGRRGRVTTPGWLDATLDAALNPAFSSNVILNTLNTSHTHTACTVNIGEEGRGEGGGVTTPGWLDATLDAALNLLIQRHPQHSEHKSYSYSMYCKHRGGGEGGGRRGHDPGLAGRHARRRTQPRLLIQRHPQHSEHNSYTHTACTVNMGEGGGRGGGVTTPGWLDATLDAALNPAFSSNVILNTLNTSHTHTACTVNMGEGGGRRGRGHDPGLDATLDAALNPAFSSNVILNTLNTTVILIQHVL